MTQPLQFKKAERSAVKLKGAIQGPSGSGKTDGALSLARQIVGPAGRIALADTENGSAALYSDRYDFDTINISPPYLSTKFNEAINAAAEAGYDILVIDSISHEWDGEGGILSRKEAADARGGNQWTNWRPFTKEHGEFTAKILSAPIHIIATMRSKQDYVLEENAKGKSAPKKVGMKAVQREGAEYEFTFNLDVQMDHRAKASKDRTGLFGDGLWDLRDPKTGKMLVDWLKSAKPDPLDEAIDEADKVALVSLASKIGGDAVDRLKPRLEGKVTRRQRDQWTAALNEKLTIQKEKTA